MKLLAVLLSSLALTVSTNAQYFSEGWAPGKAAPSKAPETATTTTGYTPQATPTSARPLGLPSIRELLKMADLSNILASGPVVELAARVGINMTDKLAKAQNYWDDRVPLITDDNYGDLIVNETMSEQEEKDRVWFVVMYVFQSIIYCCAILCSWIM